MLIVDDHPLSRQAALLTLRLRGYECLAVATADEALSSIDTFCPRVVVMEWAFRNPQDSGLGLANALRTRSNGRPLGIVVVSCADETPGFREQEGVDAYFRKPVPLHVLVDAIAALVRQ